MVCGVRPSVISLDQYWCTTVDTPGHSPGANHQDVLANVSTKIDQIIFQSRLKNLNHDNASEYKIAELDDMTFAGDGESQSKLKDNLKVKLGTVYPAEGNTNLAFPVNFEYKFSADNVDVNASQIDTACFKEDFAIGNYRDDTENPEAEKFRYESTHVGTLINNEGKGRPFLFVGRDNRAHEIDSNADINVEFRFTPQIDCIQSTSKFDVTYDISVDDALGGEINITVTADLGIVTFAPMLFNLYTSGKNPELLGSGRAEFPGNTFGTNSKVIQIAEIKACSDGACFDIGGSSLTVQEQDIKDTFTGEIESNGTSDRTESSWVATNINATDWEVDYKCGTYSLDPIGEGNLEVTHVGTDGNNENYKITLDFVSTANPCSNNLVYIHRATDSPNGHSQETWKYR